MPQCYLTGVEVDLQKAFVLDPYASKRLQAELRRRIAALERLTEQLGERDLVEVKRPGTDTPMRRKDRRLLCEGIATALTAAWPEGKLFITFAELRSRQRKAARQPQANDRTVETGPAQAPPDAGG